ncbi:hypothetical protein [Amycolatopsis sp. 195334CR]|nr:hypothetical protein [Amycolatopsis sp. 195334CR]MBN6038470.1 hypothetical protein [Amycolatopsis sp. 195334CR]
MALGADDITGNVLAGPVTTRAIGTLALRDNPIDPKLGGVLLSKAG